MARGDKLASDRSDDSADEMSARRGGNGDDEGQNNTIIQ